MAETTNIEWTGATWNPITGCSVVSPGCTNCYAMKLAGTRLRHHPSRSGLTKMTKAGPVWTGEVRFNEEWLEQPLQWKKPKDIFVVAHGDLFGQLVPYAWMHRVFDVMRRAHWHRYQVLTKRPARMRDFLAQNDRDLMRHVWLGTSVEDQVRANERREHLECVAGAGWNTWVSYEPALGPVDWTDWRFIKWLVSGGESGPGARPANPDWYRDARNFCHANRIPFFHKQNGAWVEPWAAQIDPALCEGKESVTMEPLSRQRFVKSSAPNLTLYRVGKKVAGSELDGREWKQMPGG